MKFEKLDDYTLELEHLLQEFLEIFEPTSPILFEGFDPAGEEMFVRVPEEVEELIARATLVVDAEDVEEEDYN